jgi:hypothetical protein
MPRHGWPDLHLSEFSTTQATHAQRQSGPAPADIDQALQVEHAPTLASRAVAMHLVVAFMQAHNRPQVDHAASVATREAQEASLAGRWESYDRSTTYDADLHKTMVRHDDLHNSVQSNRSEPIE